MRDLYCRDFKTMPDLEPDTHQPNGLTQKIRDHLILILNTPVDKLVKWRYVNLKGAGKLSECIDRHLCQYNSRWTGYFTKTDQENTSPFCVAEGLYFYLIHYGSPILKINLLTGKPYILEYCRYSFSDITGINKALSVLLPDTRYRRQQFVKVDL